MYSVLCARRKPTLETLLRTYHCLSLQSDSTTHSSSSSRENISSKEAANLAAGHVQNESAWFVVDSV
jgi:hypothetical protein